jgi:hypothetical protein
LESGLRCLHLKHAPSLAFFNASSHVKLPFTGRLVQNEVVVKTLADDRELLVGALSKTVSDPR